MNRDEEFLAKRIIDLADQSYRTGLYTYTGFLNQQEQSVLETRKAWDMMRAFLSAALRSVR